MKKNDVTVSKNLVKNTKKFKKLLKKTFNENNKSLKVGFGVTVSRSVFDYIKNKSISENISVSAIISNLISYLAKQEGIDLEVGNVRSIKKRKPE